MERQRFLFCGPKSCSRILAWIRIVVNVIALIIVISGIASSSGDSNSTVVKKSGERDFNERNNNSTGISGKSLEQANNDDIKQTGKNAYRLGFLGWHIFWRLIYIITSVVLLLGSYKRIPFLLKSFIIFEAISILLTMLTTILSLTLVENSEKTYPIVMCLLAVTLGTFTMWVVYCHKIEIEDEVEQAKPFAKSEP